MSSVTPTVSSADWACATFSAVRSFTRAFNVLMLDLSTTTVASRVRMRRRATCNSSNSF